MQCFKSTKQTQLYAAYVSILSPLHALFAMHFRSIVSAYSLLIAWMIVTAALLFCLTCNKQWQVLTNSGIYYEHIVKVNHWLYHSLYCTLAAKHKMKEENAKYCSEIYSMGDNIVNMCQTIKKNACFIVLVFWWFEGAVFHCIFVIILSGFVLGFSLFYFIGYSEFMHYYVVLSFVRLLCLCHELYFIFLFYIAESPVRVSREDCLLWAMCGRQHQHVDTDR